MKENILIVGGTGFLGYHFAKKCIEKKFQVTIISINKPKKKRYLSKAKYLTCDISKKKNIDKLKLKNFNYIVNFGGYVNHNEKTKTYYSHYIGCKNLAEYFLDKKIKKFIQIGSCVEYGDLKSPQIEKKINFNVKIKSIYGQSKLLASKFLNGLHKNHGFPCVILRPYLVYGPKQEINRLIPITINSCLLNKSFECSEGKQMRDFLYIDDFINAVNKTLKASNVIGKSFNVGYGKPYRVRKIIEIIRNKIKLGTPRYGKVKMRKDEILKLYPDISFTKKILNWVPKISIEKGINLTIDDYRKQK